MNAATRVRKPVVQLCDDLIVLMDLDGSALGATRIFPLPPSAKHAVDLRRPRQ